MTVNIYATTNCIPNISSWHSSITIANGNSNSNSSGSNPFSAVNTGLYPNPIVCNSLDKENIKQRIPDPRIVLQSN
jgi:hypothetical protein